MSNFTNFTVEVEEERNFEKIAQVISTNIQKISQNVASMTRMVNLLGTTQDSKDVRLQLQKVQQYTQQLVKETNSSLKVLNTIPLPASQYEQRQRKMQKERLTEEFTTALNLFQSTQRKALKKESEQMKLTRAVAVVTPMIAPPPQTDPFRDDIHPNQLIELQDSPEKTQAQLQNEQNDLIQLQEQEEALRNLERDINDVNQIYRDLGKLVHDQGEMIDSIEANIERTHVSVRDATGQLSKASAYSARLRKKRFCLFTVLAVIVIILFIYIYLQL